MMSNINAEFENYWSDMLDRQEDPSLFGKGYFKEFCREMFVNFVVNERQNNNIQSTTKNIK